MKTYIGDRQDDGTLLVHRGDLTPIPRRLDLVNHSPSGFECGYHGSGPAQLALAILADYLGDGPRAMGLYQEFKANVIAKLPQEASWRLTSEDIDRAIQQIRHERVQREGSSR